MTTCVCSECGEPVGTTANVCPHCGADLLVPYKMAGCGCFVVVLILVAVLV